MGIFDFNKPEEETITTPSEPKSIFEDKLLTMEEVQDILRISDNTVRRWEQSGKIKAYTLPTTKGKRYKASEIEQLIQPIPTKESK